MPALILSLILRSAAGLPDRKTEQHLSYSDDAGSLLAAARHRSAAGGARVPSPVSLQAQYPQSDVPSLRAQYSESDVPGSPGTALQHRLAEAACRGLQPSLREQHSEPCLTATLDSVSWQQPEAAASCGLQPCLPTESSDSDMAATPDSALHQLPPEAPSCGPATSLRAEYSGPEVSTPSRAVHQRLTSSGLQLFPQAQQSYPGVPVSPPSSSLQQQPQAAAEHRPVLRSDLLAEHLRQYVAESEAWGGATDGGGEPSEAAQLVQADDAGAAAPGRGEVGIILQPGLPVVNAGPTHGKCCIAPAVLCLTQKVADPAGVMASAMKGAALASAPSRAKAWESPTADVCTRNTSVSCRGSCSAGRSAC